MKQLIFLSFISLALGGTVGRLAPHSRASSSRLPDDRNDFMDEDWFKAGLVDDQGDGLCAVTAVDGRFKEFVPSFVFSLHRSHPRSKAIVLVADSLPSHIDEVLAQNGVPRHSYRIVVHSALRNTTGKFGSLRHPQSSRMAAARFLAIDAVAGHGCRWVYYSDVDMIFFRSESTENKSMVRWHTERMLRTRLGPFDTWSVPRQTSWAAVRQRVNDSLVSTSLRGSHGYKRLARACARHSAYCPLKMFRAGAPQETAFLTSICFGIPHICVV